MFDRYRAAALPFAALARLGLAPRPRFPVAYVVERADWSTKWDGTYICQEIERRAPGVAEVVDRPAPLTRRIVHFGSQFQWLTWGSALSRSNRFVATFFHGKREDDQAMAKHVDAFMASLPRLEKVVTAAALVERRLLDWGVPREKLVRIPIGVDPLRFAPATPEQRSASRARYGIEPGDLVIGSFQKDGVGWDDGDVPKLIKGPDVLLETVARVAKERRVFVLLTGPARGFVKQGLRQLGVRFAHDYVDDYLDLPSRYAALDVYLNPSREEGGPKGIIEAMASGVPVVSTIVGMAPDLIVDGQSGRLASPGDAEALATAILDVCNDKKLQAEIVASARAAVAICDWRNVGLRHYEEVYRPLLGK